MKNIDWKKVVIVACIVLIGVLVAQLCTRPAVTETQDYSKVIDSLQVANEQANKRFAKVSDSLDRLIKAKEKLYSDNTQRLRDITQKYIRLRNATPDKDTVVRTVTVYNGNECIEKMPVIQAQLSVANAIIVDLKNKMIVKEQQIDLLQGQVNRSLQVNADQQKDMKKLKRKLRWQKIAMIGEGVVVLGLVAYGLSQ